MKKIKVTKGAYPVKIDGIKTKEYDLWKNVLIRAYSESYKSKNTTYKNCTVSPEFEDFQYFAEWCNGQIGFGRDGWCLDKDIVFKGNKLYSQDTCFFVPKEINMLLVNNKAKRGNYPIGVSLCNRLGRYRSGCRMGGYRVEFGTHRTVGEAFLAYKLNKEAYIREKANEWRSQIHPTVYENLMLWSIDEND